MCSIIELELEIAATTPTAAQALEHQGVPKKAQPLERYQTLVAPALATYRRLAKPRALLAPVSPQTFAEVYAGAGNNAARTPVADVSARAQSLALFVLTVGEALSARIGELFAERDVAAAAMLDAVASAAAERCVVVLEEHYAATVAKIHGASPQLGVLAYSPGYCGWDITGQRSLWPVLQPEAIGVSLTDSCLMQPLKSISGVLIAGDRTIHRVTKDYPACASCTRATCQQRAPSSP